MRTSALFGAKNFGFFEIYGVSVQTSGVNISRICADVFYEWALIVKTILKAEHNENTSSCSC